MIKVLKRDGKLQNFDIAKIENAVYKACTEVYDKLKSIEIAKKISLEVEEKCFNSISVEEIQDLVIKELLKSNETDIATKYTEYRAIQSYKREMSYKKLYDRMGDIVTFGDNENSNKNYKRQSVIRDTIAGEYFRNKLFHILPKDLAEAHKTKAIHWHDSDVDPKYTNCCLVNIEDMLAKGTRINNADVETPKSVGTAMNIAMQIMADVSASQYGGVSIPNFNEVFSIYAKKNFVKNFKDYFEFLFEKPYMDNLVIDSSNIDLKNKYPKVFNKTISKTKKDIYDACQLFEYQTNSILGSAS